MTVIRKGEFIEIEYTGKLAEGGQVFDTTDAKVAAEAGLGRGSFKPAIICVGEGHLLRGLEEGLEGKPLGKHTVQLSAEQAFGKKDPKLLKLIPVKKFRDAKIEPFRGLEVNIDNHYGIVRSVSGGRITVDFNHPLAGHDLVYTVEAKRIVEDPEEQVKALLDMIGMHHHGVKLEGPEHVVISVHGVLPQPVAESINAMITKLTKVKTVTYHVDKEHHH